VIRVIGTIGASNVVTDAKESLGRRQHGSADLNDAPFVTPAAVGSQNIAIKALAEGEAKSIAER
jgi:hypothetical protein